MSQKIGETRDAIIEDDERIIQKILDANQHRTDKYWIVIFAKKAPLSFERKPTVTKLIKPYFNKKPKSMVGLIIGEVDNSKPDISWEVNMPDVPFDFGELGLNESEAMSVKSSIGSSYVYNK